MEPTFAHSSCQSKSAGASLRPHFAAHPPTGAQLGPALPIRHLTARAAGEHKSRSQSIIRGLRWDCPPSHGTPCNAVAYLTMTLPRIPIDRRPSRPADDLGLASLLGPVRCPEPPDAHANQASRAQLPMSAQRYPRWRSMSRTWIVIGNGLRGSALQRTAASIGRSFLPVATRYQYKRTTKKNTVLIST